MATTYLNRTLGTPTDSKKWTFSAWIKKTEDVTSPGDVGLMQIGSTYYTRLNFPGSGQLEFDNYDGGFDGRRMTSAFYYDPTAWYHIVAVFDSDNGNADDRMILYVNGSRITAFGTDSDPTSGATSGGNTSGEAFEIGRAAGTQYFNGEMAHAHFCDGQAYAASDFGETDSTSGIWVAKTSPAVTYGTNGVFIKFQDTSAFGDDSSGNNNDMTMSGTITQTKDNPDDNMCTMNSLDNYYAQYTFSNGNNTITNTGSKGFASATVSLFKGLWYWEIKPTAQPGGAYSLIGIADVPTQGTGASNYLGYTALEWAYYASDGNSRNNQASTSYGDTWTTDDIIGVYLDLNANKLYFAKNGTIQNSGTGISITAVGSTTNGFYFPATGYNDTSASVYQHNFGNGYFGTDLIASASADAGGEGQFKYNPSTGTFDGSSKDFRAICVNNIATYG